jgi:hypothetical protein
MGGSRGDCVKEEEKKIIERDLLERLFEDALRMSRQMDKTVALCGEHYTYRNVQKHSQYMAYELERELLGLLGYDASSQRIHEIRDRVHTDPYYAV